MFRNFALLFIAIATPMMAAPSPSEFDVVIKGGTVYDGTGGEGRACDVAIRGDRIAGIGDFKNATAKTMIDAQGLAVAPGFINMLSWSNESLIEDGRSQSEIRQGVTTEIMGEGESMGPLNDRDARSACSRAEGHQIRDQVEHARGISALSREARRLLQRRLVHRRDDDSRERDRFRGQTADAGAARANARARAAGNGSGRARDRHVADLSAGVLCEDARS